MAVIAEQSIPEYELAQRFALEQMRQQDSQNLMDAEETVPEGAPAEAKRMGFVMFVGLFMFCFLLDGIDFLTAGTIGWLIGLVGDLIIFLILGISRGNRKQFQKIVVGLLGDSIPAIAFLPIRSLMLLWAYFS